MNSVSQMKANADPKGGGAQAWLNVGISWESTKAKAQMESQAMK